MTNYGGMTPQQNAALCAAVNAVLKELRLLGQKSESPK